MSVLEDHPRSKRLADVTTNDIRAGTVALIMNKEPNKKDEMATKYDLSDESVFNINPLTFRYSRESSTWSPRIFMHKIDTS